MFNYLAQVLSFCRILYAQPGTQTSSQRILNLLGYWGGRNFSSETPPSSQSKGQFVSNLRREQFPP